MWWASSKLAVGLWGIDPDTDSDHVTVDEWLAAHRADQVEQDQVREIIESDLDELPTEQGNGSGPEGAAAQAMDIVVADIREIAEADPSETVELPALASRTRQKRPVAISEQRFCLPAPSAGAPSVR